MKSLFSMSRDNCTRGKPIIWFRNHFTTRLFGHLWQCLDKPVLKLNPSIKSMRFLKFLRKIYLNWCATLDSVIHRNKKRNNIDNDIDNDHDEKLVSWIERGLVPKKSKLCAHVHSAVLKSADLLRLSLSREPIHRIFWPIYVTI